MNKKTLRHITKALEVSLESDYRRIKIGAVIARNNLVVSTGWNRARSHPLQKHYNSLSRRISNADCIHAEMSAIVRADRHNLAGASLYVGRYERSGSLGNCKPCDACAKAIRSVGIKDVFYTTKDGIEYMRLT